MKELCVTKEFCSETDFCFLKLGAVSGLGGLSACKQASNDVSICVLPVGDPKMFKL